MKKGLQAQEQVIVVLRELQAVRGDGRSLPSIWDFDSHDLHLWKAPLSKAEFDPELVRSTANFFRASPAGWCKQESASAHKFFG